MTSSTDRQSKATDETVASSGDGSQRGLRVGLYVAAGAALLGAGYLGLAAVNADRIPAGTTIGTVDVGGLSRHDAQLKVNEFAQRAGARPITIVAEGRSLSLVPDVSGLSLRTDNALADLTGFTLQPSAIWHRLTGGHEHRGLPTVVDRSALQSAIEKAGATLHGAPRAGAIGYVNGQPVVTRESTAGTGLQPGKLTDQIAQGWPATLTYTATLSHQAPDVSNDQLSAFAQGPALTAVSGPVTVTSGGRTAMIDTAQIASAIEVVDDNGTLKLQVKHDVLTGILSGLAQGLSEMPHNGRVVISASGSKSYTAPSPSSAIDPTASDADFLKAISSPSVTPNAATDGTDGPSRSFEAHTKQVPPTMSLAQLKSLRLDQISQFDVFLPGGPTNAARTKNIKLALNTINGMVIDKGGRFSLLEALGPLDAKDGYVDAPTIQGGIEKPALAGGLSQVSTTLYNAAYFSGTQIDAHTPHAFWISRYPVGREATLWTGYIDNRWTNTTNGPIVIQAGVVGDQSGVEHTRITFLGTPTYTVTSTTGQRTHIVQPKEQKISDPACIPQDPVEGFDIVVTRVVSRNGKVVAVEPYKTHYIPADKVTCTAKK